MTHSLHAVRHGGATACIVYRDGAGEIFISLAA
jgi:hypothetical protein